MARFSSFVVIFLLCVTSCYATKAKVVDVDTICKKATHHSFCSTLLNSKHVGGRDLISLAHYTIDVVRVNVTNSIKLIKTLIAQSGSNANAREHYQMCLISFGKDVLGEVVDAQQYLKKGDYEALIQCASGIIAYVEGCISGEYPGDPTYPDTSLLPEYADIVQQVAEIILIISDYLIHA